LLFPRPSLPVSVGASQSRSKQGRSARAEPHQTVQPGHRVPKRACKIPFDVLIQARAAYERRGQTFAAIAAHLDVAERSLERWLKRLGVTPRPRGPRPRPLPIAEIVRKARRGWSARAIARDLGVEHHRVIEILRANDPALVRPPRRRWPPKVLAFEALRPPAPVDDAEPRRLIVTVHGDLCGRCLCVFAAPLPCGCRQAVERPPSLPRGSQDGRAGHPAIVGLGSARRALRAA
jgi:hypothetical protein